MKRMKAPISAGAFFHLPIKLNPYGPGKINSGFKRPSAVQKDASIPHTLLSPNPLWE